MSTRLVNEGKAAGASLPHTHSQLVWLREPPPAVSRRATMDAVTEGEPVLERAASLRCAQQSRPSPTRCGVAPAKRESRSLSRAHCLRGPRPGGGGLRRLRAVEPGAPANLWLHDGPWWHIDLVPRLSVAAGIELGAGIDVNPLPPEEAAARLRG